MGNKKKIDLKTIIFIEYQIWNTAWNKCGIFAKTILIRY